MTQVGQDQVDAGLVVGGEHHPAIDDEQPAEMLENRHVAADFADPTERCDPQPARGQGTWWGEFFVHCQLT
ncbi:hypothetical protein Mkiyose1665_19190 [Mycobacterium kiyosense]|uniref:Uncharacterized protein n=1 Tax=Mycobacterium kiyosense TaxID=2871094 RepID=A0A9P3UYH2_9MYCO|nr:hypothetical protein MKCMC460_22740 [Mycobacterium sp. 20KCMC460]GLB94728.1 hypothetical protein SRL2020226_15040 [Mycobacterium kiyosense]GLC12470.1 hypothetical protein SRL2020448_10730 [Mycobacterium kiyosense]GLD16894.1 hypothetical protein Mkiyose1385_09930 [Mycobacterium kiyosense]GLD29342.1 hypothetical protein Mkiyose1413_12250 [Mycobacterium kiyosense]